MIHEEICTYEVCKLAKEKGFNWQPSMYFHSGVERDLREVGVNGANPNKIPHSPHISCPTQTQLQRWLREEKKYAIAVFWDMLSKDYRYEIVKTIEADIAGGKGKSPNPKTDDIVNRYLLAGVGGILVLTLVSRIRRRYSRKAKKIQY